MNTTTYLYQRKHLRWEQLPADVQSSLLARGLGQQSTHSTLPDGFPGQDALQEAGFTTLASLPTNRETLEAITGIGPKTATQILTILVEEGLASVIEETE